MTDMLTRRAMLGATAALLGTQEALAARKAISHPGDLKSLTSGAQPISATERAARIARLQELLQQQKLAALLVESGSTLDYFTNVKWWLSERVTAAVIPATGKPVVVTPFFEAPSIREMLQGPAEIRTWQEDENPFELIAATLDDRAIPAGPLAVEPNTRFFVFDAVTRALT